MSLIEKTSLIYKSLFLNMYLCKEQNIAVHVDSYITATVCYQLDIVSLSYETYGITLLLNNKQFRCT